MAQFVHLIKKKLWPSQQRGAPIRTQMMLMLVPGIVLLLLVTILQDYLQAQRNNYAFYFSESLLFKTFWILFIPVGFWQFFLFRKTEPYFTGRTGWLRIPAFIFSATITHMALYALLVFVLSGLFFSHTYAVQGVIGYTLSEDTYKYLLIYGALAVLQNPKSQFRMTNTPANPLQSPSDYLQQIIVGQGRSRFAIAIDDIIYISAANPYIAIYTARKKFLHAETLKTILAQLPAHQFVRVHKSTIVNLAKIISYKSRLNGDYDIILNNQHQVRLSRNYLQTFKKHMGESSSG